MALKNPVLQICKSVIFLMAALFVMPTLQAHHRDSVTVAGVEFVRNDRQWDERVLYKASLHGGALFAERDGFTFVLLHPQHLKEFYAAKSNPSTARSNGIIDAAAYKLVFAGAVDTQVTDAPGATEETIRAEVRRVIDTLGKGGGLMASSSVMFSIVPKVDGIIDDEGKRYGNYATLKFS